MFEDSQSDPRQSVAIAQKFVADPKIVVELGDFSSTASMAASPIYQRAGLVQFGFTNSHPDFTKGGDYMWSNSVSQADEQPLLAKYAARLGLKHVAVLYLNTDWGRTSKDIFVEAAKGMGAEVVASKATCPTRRTSARRWCACATPSRTAIMLISYYADGALIARQIRKVGLKQPIVAGGSIYSPKFIELGGDAGQRRVHRIAFLPRRSAARGPDLRHEVSRPSTSEQPDDFNAVAYDTIILLAAVMNEFGIDRTAIHDGLAQDQGRAERDLRQGDVRSADAPRRRRRAVYLVVKDGQFTLWDGKKPFSDADNAFDPAGGPCIVAASRRDDRCCHRAPRLQP